MGISSSSSGSAITAVDDPSELVGSEYLEHTTAVYDVAQPVISSCWDLGEMINYYTMLRTGTVACGSAGNQPARRP